MEKANLHIKSDRKQRRFTNVHLKNKNFFARGRSKWKMAFFLQNAFVSYYF